MGCLLLQAQDICAGRKRALFGACRELISIPDLAVIASARRVSCPAVRLRPRIVSVRRFTV
jgi:hypothetical protein